MAGTARCNFHENFILVSIRRAGLQELKRMKNSPPQLKRGNSCFCLPRFSALRLQSRLKSHRIPFENDFHFLRETRAVIGLDVIWEI